MENLRMFSRFSRNQKITKLLVAAQNGQVSVIFDALTLWQILYTSFGIRQYITLDELSRLYCETPEDRRHELSPILSQVSKDFYGWLEIFKTNRFNQYVRLMATDGLIMSAKNFSQRQTLTELDIDFEKRKEIMETMKKEAGDLTEIMVILRQEFDLKLYRRALRLADSPKKLSLLLELNINSRRRAYLYGCLLKYPLTTEKLLSIYRHLPKKSIMRSRILETLDQRPETFAFWLKLYRGEPHYNKLKRLAWKHLLATADTPENLVNTCNNYRDKRFRNMAADKIKEMELRISRLDSLYEQTTANLPTIRRILLDKKRMAISLDNNYEDSLKFFLLQALYFKSAQHRALAEEIMLDMINLLPGHQDSNGSNIVGPGRYSIFNSITNLLLKSNLRSLGRLLKIFVKRLRNREEWASLLLQCKGRPKLKKVVVREYRKFFAKKLYSEHPADRMTANGFTNRDTSQSLMVV